MRDLLTPEAQRDPYVWSAVLIAHAGLGVAGWAMVGWWAVLVYGAFEAAQALAARRLLFWDSVLDACGFACGALLAASIWAHDGWLSAAAIVACACIAFAGALARR